MARHRSFSGGCQLPQRRSGRKPLRVKMGRGRCFVLPPPSLARPSADAATTLRSLLAERWAGDRSRRAAVRTARAQGSSEASSGGSLRTLRKHTGAEVMLAGLFLAHGASESTARQTHRAAAPLPLAASFLPNHALRLTLWEFDPSQKAPLRQERVSIWRRSHSFDRFCPLTGRSRRLARLLCYVPSCNLQGSQIVSLANAAG